jgi:hypothetical protein
MTIMPSFSQAFRTLSFRKAEAWLAARFARPDVPSVIRKLPQRAIAAAVASRLQADAAALPARACAAAEPQRRLRSSSSSNRPIAVSSSRSPPSVIACSSRRAKH